MFVCNTWNNTCKENRKSSSKNVCTWIETAATWKLRSFLRRSTGILTRYRMLHFINTEAGIATDPVFLREALHRLDGSSDRPDRYNKGKGYGNTKTYGDLSRAPHHVSNQATDVTSDQKVGSLNSAITCKLFCNGHDLDDGQAYLKRSLADRKEFL